MNEMILLAVIVVMLMGVAVAIYLNQRQRSRQLRAHFGPEYSHALEGFGERRAAERALVERTRRVEKLAIHSLPALRRGELSSRWQVVQAEFVDDPASAVRDAHELLDTVIREQGYPTGKFEDEIELLSVHHPATVQHYRAAHRLAEDREHGDTATEDLRQAMIHYRALFDDLLNAGIPREPSRRPEVRHEA